MQKGGARLTPLVLKGGASVTVCTSDVERDVNELSGTLDTAALVGVLLAALADETDGDEPAVVLSIDDADDDADDGVNVELLGIEDDTAGDPAVVLMIDDSDDTIDAELPAAEVDTAEVEAGGALAGVDCDDEGAIVLVDDDDIGEATGGVLDVDGPDDEAPTALVVDTAGAEVEVVLSAGGVDTDVGDEANVDVVAGEPSAVDVAELDAWNSGGPTSGKPWLEGNSPSGGPCPWALPPPCGTPW